MVDESTRLRVIRAIIGWDMKKLSERLGVNPNTITGWEKGRSVPNNVSRLAIAEICQEHNISIRPDGFPVPSDGA